MEFQFTVSILTTLLCILLQESDSKCPPGEVYKSCGTACPPTCVNGGNTNGCPSEPCVSGCFCKDGLVRAMSKKCIDPDDCDKCVQNETYTDCGSSCEYSCANYGDPIGCAAVCVKGCFCTKGYHRDDTGQCVLLKDCPPRKCGKGEYFSTCGPYCQPYCKDLGNDGCKDECKYGCFCKKGYYLSNRSDKCVALEDCQSACPEGEIFDTCGTACQPYCADPSPACTKQCSRSCFCPSGYIREYKGGSCIDKDECPE